MRTRSTLPILLLAATSACGLLSRHELSMTDSAPIVPFPAVTKTLENGLEVIIVRTGFPNIVSLQIPVKTGSRNEVEPGKSGFAHFFEHMMFRGTKNYPPEKYQDIVNRAGARQNAYTTDDFTNYHITFAAEDLEKILEIEADRFQHLEYSLAAFQTEARAVLGEYNKNFANPIRKLFEVQRNAVYTTHPYKHTTMGFIEDIEDMPNEFEYSREFFDRWYRPENAAIVLIGDLDPDQTFALVEKHWSSWKRGSYRVEIPQEPAATGTIWHHHKAESPMPPLLAVAFRGARFDTKTPDTAALELMVDLWFGETSQLYNRLVREEQKVDLFFAGNATNEDPDLINVIARVKKWEDVNAVRDAILETMARATIETVDPAKLADAKSYLRYGFAAGMSSNEAIGAILARFIRYERSFDTVNELFATYDQVTPELLRDTAKRYASASPTTVTLMSFEEPGADAGKFPTIAELAGTLTPSAVVAAAAPAVPTIALSAPAVDSAATDPQSIVLRTATPQIVMKLVFQTGSAMDPPGKEGLADLSARMIAGAGSKHHTLDEIGRLLYPIAGDFRAQVDRELTVFTGSIHKDNLERFVAIALEQLLAPGFRDADFQRNLEAAKNALKVDLRANNDEELGKELLHTSIHAGSGYGHTTVGTVAGLDSITLDDVKEFVARHYTSGNLRFAVSGDLPESELAGLRHHIASRLPKGAARAELGAIVGKRSEGLTIDIVEKDTRATALSLGHPIEVRRGHADFVALYLARTWLGEHRSSLSWLYQRLRELRGMNYGDYAYVEAFPNGGSSFFPPPNVARRAQIFEIWIRPVPPEQAHFALRAALYEFDKLVANGLTQEQFESTREYLMKNVFLLTDGQERQLGYAIDSRIYGTPEYTEYMRSELAKLSLADVNAAMKRHFTPANMHVVFVTKDASALRAALLADEFSPITYTAEKPADVLAEDQVIGSRKLNLREEQVRIVPVDDVFAK